MKVYNKQIAKEFVNITIKSVKAKKELTNLDNSFISDYLRKFLEQNTKLLDRVLIAKDFSKLKKNKLFNEMIKYIRKEAHLVYGMYQKPSEIKKRKDLLKKLKKGKNVINDILKTHISSSERIEIYDKFLMALNSHMNKKKDLVFVDVAAGLNPIALYDYLVKIKDRKVTFYAIELNQDDADYLNDYFTYLSTKNKNFTGKAFALDLRRDYHQISNLIKLTKNTFNVCFMFKIGEILERYKKHFLFNIFDQLKKINLFVVSFPLQTLRQTRTTNKRRLWFEKMASKLIKGYSLVQLENEIFYFVK